MTQPDCDRALIAQVSEQRLMETTRRIARWVRLSGSPEEMQAVEYVRDLLLDYGLDTELILHDAYISLPGAASITADGETLPAITHSFAAPTPPDGLTGELVPWRPGNGLPLPDVRGKIAFVGGLAMPESVKLIEGHGAAAQVYVNGPRTHEMIVSPVWGSPDDSNRANLPHTPILSVDTATSDRLQASLANQAQISLHSEVETGWRSTPILTASLPGLTTDDFVLFSGHIDSWHYGAMDNGTANATMVEIARILASNRDRLRRGLRLAFWSGHSHGRYSSSAWYADNHWGELRQHCVAHVNIDSVGAIAATVLSEGVVMACTRPLAARAIAKVTGQRFHGSRVGRSGDQSFVGLGIPSLWMSLSEQEPSSDQTAAAFGQLVPESHSGGLGWWWHTPEDTIDKIDPALLTRDARVYLVAIDRLVSSPLLPLSAADEARQVLDLLQGLQRDAGDRFDLSETIDRASQVAEQADRLAGWARDQGDEPPEEHRRTFDRTVAGILRTLIPINYTSSGPFGHDPALRVPPLPLLHGIRDLVTMPVDSDAQRFLTVELVRNRNRVLYGLEDALRVAERGLDALIPEGQASSNSR